MPAGSKIIIFGFGLSGESIDIADLIEFGYYNRGFAFFSPAGSAASWLPVVFPAYMDEVFAVTARSSTTVAHPLTHVGAAVDGIAFAPVFVSGNLGIGHSSLDASSAATALVGGVAALVSRKYPSLTNAQIYDRLRSTSREFCGPAHFGVNKIINAEAALGGLCVPPAQFNVPTYFFFKDGPTQYTHSYCFQFSGGVLPVATVQHLNPHPTLPGCGTITVVPNPTDSVSYISVPASVYDSWTSNPPISNLFRVKIVTQLGCPPAYPDCM